jgi:hypothetical protein
MCSEYSFCCCFRTNGSAKSLTVPLANVAAAESRLLHGRPLEQILTWMKSHLDAYLAMAEVILEQNVDPG